MESSLHPLLPSSTFLASFISITPYTSQIYKHILSFPPSPTRPHIDSFYL